jgi:hypothetical protein
MGIPQLGAIISPSKLIYCSYRQNKNFYPVALALIDQGKGCSQGVCLSIEKLLGMDVSKKDVFWLPHMES